MTDTVGDAILAAITANWTGAGGTIPKLYSKEDTQVMPDAPDFMWMLTDTADEDPARFNNDFNIITTTIDMFVSSKQDANREQRLDTILNELKRIINPTNVTGFKDVRVSRTRRIPSDKRFGVYAAIVTFFLKSSLVSNKVTPGSTASASFETDELTVNDWLKVPLIKSADGTDTIELLAGEATFPNPVNIEDELVFGSAILHSQASNFHMHPASGNADIRLTLHPLGTNTKSTFQCRNAASPANYGALEFSIDGATGKIVFVQGGGGTPPTKLEINGYDHAAALMIGVANAEFIPCVFEIAGGIGSIGKMYLNVTTMGITNVDTTSFLVSYRLPLPTNRGGLKLYVDDLRVGVHTADATDYLTRVRIYGINHDGATSLQLDSTNRTSQGSYVYPFAATDASGYESIVAMLHYECDSIDDLVIQSTEILCYYDT